MIAALLLTLLAAQTDQPVRIALITPYPQMVPPGLALFERQYGRARIDLELVTPNSKPARLERAQVIAFVHNSTVFTPEQKQALQRAAARGALVTASFPDLVEQRMGLQSETAISLKIDEYWKNGGAENIAAFFALLHNARAPRQQLPVPAPIALRTTGVYHPGASELAPTLDAYLTWYRAKRRPTPPATAPVIGITFFHTSYKTGDLAHINALIAEIEKHGLIPAAMCGWPPAQELPRIFNPRQHPLRALLVMNYNFARPEDATLLETIDVPAISLMTTRQSFAIWKDSPHGIQPEGLAQQVSAPERAGVAEPIVIATSEQSPGSTERYFQPIPDRITAAVARARRWLTLQTRPNFEKRLAMLYYNNPAGKGGIGASYLNVPGTIRALLDRLRDEGYHTGGEPAPDEKTLIQLLEQSGRNVEVWAPGELDRMVSARHTVLITMEKYRRWFATLPAAFQASILRHWGPPEKTRLMVIRDRDNQPYFVVPGLRFGNVFLGPQPLKSSFEEAAKSQHNTAIPPPHAYIAAYLWYRHEFLADAVIHLGRHGTLEFLPGKNVGQSGTDASEVILGDLPNAYYYILDGGGESTIARRRSAAVLIGHLTPMVVPAGQQAGFDKLRQLLKDYQESASEPLKAEYEKGLRAEIISQKLHSQLSLNLTDWSGAVEHVKAFLEETESGAIPLGIHTVGTPPRDQLQQEAVAQYVRDTFKDPNTPQAKAAADNWLARLRQSPARELDALPRILSGHFQPSGMSGDPLRTPEALPSGRNLHDFDPTRIPTKEACAVAKRLADGMVANYKASHGAYPEKIAMVLWYGETARHQGVLECQALALLGVEPVWNNRGVPDSLRLIPLADLKRPRVDVVYTLGGIYRDGFPDKVLLLDKATQLVANTAENGDNVVARNTARIAAALRQAGLDEATAARAARARAFAAAPGDYGAAIAKIAKQSRDQDGELVSTYLNHMGHAYSSELWGQSVPNALSSHLKGNQVVLNSRSSAVYGVLDNDDFFEFTGGLNAASKEANGGAAPQFLVVDVRKRGNERVTPMKQYLATELNARFWNPKWIEEMQRGGYSGARELADNMENLYGWQATSKEIMDGAFWQNSYDVYVKDKHNLGLKDFFQKESPHARQAMLARLLEVDRQGSHKFSPEDRARLVREFITSVNQSGTACSANVCGNRRLRTYAIEQARNLNQAELSEADRRRFEQQYRETTQAPHAPPASQPSLTKATPKPQPKNKLAALFDKVRLITPEEWAQVARVRPFGIPPFWLFAPLPLGAMYGWYRRRNQGRTEAAMLRLSLTHPPRH